MCLMSLIALCEPLQELFQHSDPEAIASLLLEGYNSIIDTISPEVRKQVKSSRKFKQSEKTIAIQEKIQLLFAQAKMTGLTEDWRNYKNAKNQLTRSLKSDED